MNEALTWILDVIQNVDPIVRTLLAGVGMLLETSILIGLIVPGDTIVIVASTGIQDAFQYVALVIAVLVGSLTGESIGFALGRFFGPKIRGSRLGQRIGYENWMRAENYVDRRGGIAVFISRFLPVLHSLVPLTVGMSTMRFRKFLVWTVPACLIWATAYASVGWAAAGTYRELSGQLHYAGYVFAGIIALFLLVALGVRMALTRNQRRHMELPGDGDANTREDLP
ncbi:membrane protein DedA with SNARE-associated domain [Cryobacterium mesophilum]|uniref:DedA family protein n=1 Tax=Terrimesophilobacter mesophilus TaxID=433647 RepID=A0A4R8V8T2_9MICO|nr:DedA family protein [Terrimesophilobacter mesophilus]MBB5632273.1 membrane protein DedA with SNARE-associated domain [Terrimesophilobacter mesophilus]TFB79123.1 DedA family protein [Terrimesophilobacter mesophilus]